MELINYHFDKPWYKQSELIIKLGMSNICLKRYMSEQLKAGKELSAMGYLKFKGFKEPCIDIKNELTGSNSARVRGL